MSFEISPVIAQVCAAHILLNIHDIMQMSHHDPYEESKNHRPDVGYSNGTNWHIDLNGSSFPLDPLPPKSRIAHDLLDFDTDVIDRQLVTDVRPVASPSHALHVGPDKAYEFPIS